jgi:hypothetical protein
MEIIAILAAILAFGLTVYFLNKPENPNGGGIGDSDGPDENAN